MILLVIVYRKIIPLVILEEDSYEKDVLFYMEISNPQQLGGEFPSQFILSIVLRLIPQF